MRAPSPAHLPCMHVASPLHGEWLCSMQGRPRKVVPGSHAIGHGACAPAGTPGRRSGMARAVRATALRRAAMAALPPARSTWVMRRRAWERGQQQGRMQGTAASRCAFPGYCMRTPHTQPSSGGCAAQPARACGWWVRPCCASERGAALRHTPPARSWLRGTTAGQSTIRPHTAAPPGGLGRRRRRRGAAGAMARGMRPMQRTTLLPARCGAAATAKHGRARLHALVLWCPGAGDRTASSHLSNLRHGAVDSKTGSSVFLACAGRVRLLWCVWPGRRRCASFSAACMSSPSAQRTRQHPCLLACCL